MRKRKCKRIESSAVSNRVNLWVCADAAPFRRMGGGKVPPILDKEGDVRIFYACHWWPQHVTTCRTEEEYGRKQGRFVLPNSCRLKSETSR
jgi:hypothetical protein